MTTNILITGSRAPVALDLARALHKSGYTIYTADSTQYPLCRYSRSCKESFLVASPRLETENYIKDLLSICKTYHITKIIPTCEEVFYLSLHKERFPQSIEVFTHHFPLMRTLHNKWEFIQLLEQMGFKAPQTQLIQKREDLCKLKKPFVLKPIYSRFGSKVHIVKEKSGLPEITCNSNWIAQEYFPGKVWCSYSVVRNGKISLHANYASEFKVGSGASIHFKHQNVPYIEEWVKAFVSKIHFTGQIAFDFIELKDIFIPIECNPRATSGIHLLSSLPSFADAFLNGCEEILQPQEEQEISLKLAMYLFGLSSIRSFNDLKKWGKAMRSHDIIFKSKDPMPSLTQLMTFGEFWLLGLKHKMSAVQASTYDIEYNEEILP